jgi:hypothetical protein
MHRASVQRPPSTPRYALRHATGKGKKLFGSLSNLKRDLRMASMFARIPPLSPHPLRRACGQWLVDLGVSIEDVSVTLGHHDSRITQQHYAAPDEKNVGGRILARVNPKYAKRALKLREIEPEKWMTLTKLPEPASIVFRYTAGGETHSIQEWAMKLRAPMAVIFPDQATPKNIVKWSGRRDSNPRPSDPQSDALPGCATPRDQLDYRGAGSSARETSRSRAECKGVRQL